MRITQLSAGLVMGAVIATAGSSLAQTPTPPPAPPVPSPDTIHKTLNVFVYPAKKQSPAQQTKDESACYTWAQSQTSIDPMAPPPAPQAPAQTAQAPNGQRVRGAARGAAAGAAIGAVAGNPGGGAAAGAAVGTVAGGARKRQSQAAAQQQQQQAAADAQHQAAAEQQQRLDTFKKAYSACVAGRGYSVQ